MRFDANRDVNGDANGDAKREHVGDQAEGLRQLRRPETVANVSDSSSLNVSASVSANVAVSDSARVLNWPRIVLISEYPSTDAGARFAYHLALALTRTTRRAATGHAVAGDAAGQSLLIDLAPAASRLPQVLADRLPADRYPPLWSELAAGRTLAPLKIGGEAPLAVAAEYNLVPAVLDQLPRLYEQLVRQLSRSGERLGWIVMLALEHVVPLDRPCWQAADDIVLLGGAGESGCQRQAAALRSRLSELDPERSLWTLPKRRATWFGRRSNSSLGSAWLQTGLAPQSLPAVSWPHDSADGRLIPGSRADHALERSALCIANHLRARSLNKPAPTAKSA